MVMHAARVLLSTAVCLLALGCVPTLNTQAVTSGLIGCAPDEIEILAEDGDLTYRTWTARCNGKTYFCSAHARGVQSTSQASCGEGSANASRYGSIGAPPPAEPPDGAAGFSFGSDAATASSVCTDAGKTWTPPNDAGKATCSGAAAGADSDMPVVITFCGDAGVCALALTRQFKNEVPAYSLLRSYESLRSALRNRYGAPSDRGKQLTEKCRSDVRRCLATEPSRLQSSWQWSTGASVDVTLTRARQTMLLYVSYRNGATSAPAAEAKSVKPPETPLAPGAAPPAAAPISIDQVAAAKALYEHALTKMDAGDYLAACPELEESIRIEPRAVGARLTLAACYERAGKLASAWAAYALAEQSAASANQPDRQKKAQERGAALAPRLAKLVIVVPEALRAERGLQITRDGISVGAAHWGVPIPIDRGQHELIAILDGATLMKKPFEVRHDGFKVTIELSARGRAAPSPRDQTGAAPARP